MSSSPEISYESGRLFEVWTWGAGGQRSRIEVWFKPGYTASLPSYLRGLQIIRASADASAHLAVLGRPTNPGEELFTVHNGESLGWVVAEAVHGREYGHDENDHSGPSSRGT